MERFYYESDGCGTYDRAGRKCHYVVDRFADPLGDQRRTDVESRAKGRKLARKWNARPPWPPWDTIQAEREGYKMPLFSVIEYSSFFAVRHNPTGHEHPMGDGVDVLFDEDDKAISPGTPGFVEKWEHALNEMPDETLEAYFPEEVENESVS